MKLEDLNNGQVVYSDVTEIFYKKTKGEIYAFPAYTGAERVWNKTGYRGNGSHFRTPTKEELEELKNGKKSKKDLAEEKREIKKQLAKEKKELNKSLK